MHSMKGWLYLTCVRFRDQGHVRSYSVFMDGIKIVDDHTIAFPVYDGNGMFLSLGNIRSPDGERTSQPTRPGQAT